jgi:HlyD family secretion protein
LVYSIHGLESGSGIVYSGALAAIGTRGLYAQFSSSNYANDVWTIEIPNTKAANYTINLNAYNAAVQSQQVAISGAQNAIASAQSALDQANASLNLKKAQARPADVAVARAQILSADGQVQAASASLENTVIRAPSDGTITSVDIKVGEQASPAKEAIILQDVNNLHVEANVSEANIAEVKTGQAVSFTFDALGPARVFNGTVVTIDPASTVVSGVVNYKVTASVDKVAEIKPGMTANMTIQTAAKPGVLVVPSRAIVDQDGKHYVRVIDDSKKKTYHQVEITEGLQGDGGLVEIVSGLTEGQEIVAFINTK